MYFNLNRQPFDLGYFEEATDFLASRDEVDATNGLHVCGISKGGELGLLMAAFFGHKINSVAAMNCPVNLGLVPAVYRGKPVVPGLA